MRFRHGSGAAIVAAAAIVLQACAAAGPSSDAIESGAATAKEPLKDYVLVEMSQPVVDIISQYRVAPFATRFAGPRPAPGQIIGVGDSLTITLFEAGQGGLFSSEQGARVTIQQVVDSDGSITIPYGGRIKAAGEGPQSTERRIVAALEGRAIQPQALVQIVNTVSRSFVVNGEVGRPGRFPITAAGDRVLDAIATAGGARQEAFATRVTLQRGSSQGSAIMKDLVDNPPDNVFVQPNDRIFVTKDPEIFLAFGAIPQPGPYEFGYSKLSLLEAVGKAGGLIDNRSDAKGGFFLFRYEPVSAVRSIKPDYNGKFTDRVPVVYRVNLADPKAYFFARNFAVRDRDLIYVANSPFAEVQKFLQIIGATAGVAQNAVVYQRVTR